MKEFAFDATNIVEVIELKCAGDVHAGIGPERGKRFAQTLIGCGGLCFAEDDRRLVKPAAPSFIHGLDQSAER